MREQIIELREKGFSYKQISEELNCAKSTVSYHLKMMKMSPVVDVKILDTNEVISKYYELKSLKKVSIFFEVSRERVSKICKEHIPIVNETKPKTSKENVVSWRRRVKIRLVEYKGGCCQSCGYDRSFRALHFHHIDPLEKDFGVSGKTKAFETLKQEVDKCVLVCSNCHGEIHDEIDEKGYSDIVNDIINKNT